jgi:hypothetical protein
MPEGQTWIDTARLLPGADTGNQTRRAAAGAGFVFVFVSDAYFQSSSCAIEWEQVRRKPVHTYALIVCGPWDMARHAARAPDGRAWSELLIWHPPVETRRRRLLASLVGTKPNSLSIRWLLAHLCASGSLNYILEASTPAISHQWRPTAEALVGQRRWLGLERRMPSVVLLLVCAMLACAIFELDAALAPLADVPGAERLGAARALLGVSTALVCCACAAAVSVKLSSGVWTYLPPGDRSRVPPAGWLCVVLAQLRVVRPVRVFISPSLLELADGFHAQLFEALELGGALVREVDDACAAEFLYVDLDTPNAVAEPRHEPRLESRLDKARPVPARHMRDPDTAYPAPDSTRPARDTWHPRPTRDTTHPTTAAARYPRGTRATATPAVGSHQQQQPLAREGARASSRRAGTARVQPAPPSLAASGTAPSSQSIVYYSRRQYSDVAQAAAAGDVADGAMRTLLACLKPPSNEQLAVRLLVTALSRARERLFARIASEGAFAGCGAAAHAMPPFALGRRSDGGDGLPERAATELNLTHPRVEKGGTAPNILDRGLRQAALATLLIAVLTCGCYGVWEDLSWKRYGGRMVVVLPLLLAPHVYRLRRLALSLLALATRSDPLAAGGGAETHRTWGGGSLPSRAHQPRASHA